MKTIIKFFFFFILLLCTINIYSDDFSTEKKLIIDTRNKKFTIIFIPIQNKEISFLNENGLQWYDNGMIKSGTLFEYDTQLVFTPNKDKLWFKSNTNVIFDKNGLIKSGTLVDGSHIEAKEIIILKKNTLLKTPGGSEIEFKKNSRILKNQNNEVIWSSNDSIIFIPNQNKEISFLNENGLQWYDNGMIKSGTLEYATPLFFTSNEDKLWFKIKTNVIFDKNGLIESGTLVDGRHIESKEIILLKKNTSLKIPGGSELEFLKNSRILKNQNGEVIYGTLTDDLEFHNMASGRDIWFKKGHPILIDSKGNIREGVLLKNTELMMILHKRYIWLKKDFSVLLDQEGRIRSGTLLESTYVKTYGPFLWAAPDSVINFDEDGYAL